MIKIAVLDISGADTSLLLPTVAEELQGKIEGTKSENERALRIAAYALLSHTFCEFMAKNGEKEAKMPTILYTNEGKPYFDFDKESLKKGDTPPPSFSISHSERLAVVAITDGCHSIGVDVQKMPKKSLLARVAKRFFARFYNNENECLLDKAIAPELEIQISYYNLNEGKIEKISSNEEIERHFSPRCEGFSGEEAELLRWSILEANLKTSRGFGDYPESEKLIQKTKAKASIISLDGEIYSLAVALD